MSKTKKPAILAGLWCDRGGVRTPNPQSRNLIFYPVELRSLIYLRGTIYEIVICIIVNYFFILIFVSSSGFLPTLRGENCIKNKKILLKTVLDTFFVLFHSTKNTRTDVFNYLIQNVLILYIKTKIIIF